LEGTGFSMYLLWASSFFGKQIGGHELLVKCHYCKKDLWVMTLVQKLHPECRAIKTRDNKRAYHRRSRNEG